MRRILAAIKRLFRFRNSMTGRFVSKRFAEKHPDVTIKERIEP